MKLKITRANENKFESGLRGFFEYKNLGIEEATSGNFGANVIRAIEGKHANGEWHYHKAIRRRPATLTRSKTNLYATIYALEMG